MMLFLRSVLHVGVIYEADHHLFPGLVAPADQSRWIRITRILSGVVEMSGALDARARGKSQWLDQAIGRLPVEIEARHGKQRLFGAVRKDRAIFEALAAQVHVRE